MQPHPGVSLNIKSIANKMANYVAIQAQFMGLDEEAERLLWSAYAMQGHQVDDAIVKVLATQAEMNPIRIHISRITVEIAPEWVKPRGVFRKRSHLVENLRPVVCNSEFVYFADEEPLIKREVEVARLRAFEDWYDQLEARVIEGKVVEVDSSKIAVTIKHKTINLREELLELIGQREGL